MTREEKLAKLKADQENKARLIVTDGSSFLESLNEQVEELKDILGSGVELTNLDDLIDQLKEIKTLEPTILELKDGITKAIDSIPDYPDKVEITGLSQLVMACKAIAERKDPKPIETKAFDSIADNLKTLIKQINKLEVPKQGQKPEDYIPMRRVMKVGEKLLYDDSFYTGGGGGGSGIAQYVDANGVTQNVGPNYPLPTTATINTGDIEIGAVEIKDGASDTRQSVAAGDTNQNFGLVGGARMEVSFSTTTAQAVATTDVSGYNSVSVQVTSQGGSSTITFQGSNDNINWVSQGLLSLASVGTSIASTTTTSTGVIFSGPCPYRYFRLNVTGIVSGSTDGIVEFKSVPFSPTITSGFVSALSAGTTGPMKAEDAAHASADQGFPAWAIRRDTPVVNANVSADGDYTPILGDNLGKTWTAQTQVEDAAHASGDRGSFILGVRNDNGGATTLTDTNGDYSPIAVDTKGRLLTNSSKVEDNGHVNGEAGDFILGVRNDAQTVQTSTDGDYSPISTDGAGNVMDVGNVASGATDSGNPIKVGGKYNSTKPTFTDGQRGDGQLTSRGSLITTLFVNDSNNQIAVAANNADGTATSSVASRLETISRNTLFNGTTWDRQPGDTTGAFTVGNVASGVADAGNPVKIGGLAKTAEPTSVSDGQRVNALFGKGGKLIVRHALRESIGNQQTTITSSTSETTIVTADATYLLDLYGLVITNTSATYTKVTIKDSTTGTTRFVFSVPAQETRGFMLPSDAGHKQATANNNWTATCGTSVASIEITAMYAKNL